MLLSQPFFLLFCLSFAVIERLPGTTLLGALEQSRPRSRKTVRPSLFLLSRYLVTYS